MGRMLVGLDLRLLDQGAWSVFWIRFGPFSEIFCSGCDTMGERLPCKRELNFVPQSITSSKSKIP